jgi:hypothetical protein
MFGRDAAPEVEPEDTQRKEVFPGKKTVERRFFIRL